MFLLCFKPTAATKRLDVHRVAHLAWAARGFETGIFLAGGRCIPAPGGVILATHDRAAVERHIAQEPFRQRGLANIDLQEIEITSTAPGLEKLKQTQVA